MRQALASDPAEALELSTDVHLMVHTTKSTIGFWFSTPHHFCCKRVHLEGDFSYTLVAEPAKNLELSTDVYFLAHTKTSNPRAGLVKAWNVLLHIISVV